MALSRCDCSGIRLLFGLVLVLLTWLALTPAPMALPEVPIADKWAHMLAYLVLATLIDLGWPDRGFDPAKWGFLFAYGVAIELIQSQIPNRYFSLGDMVANSAGIAAYGLLVIHLFRARGWR